MNLNPVRVTDLDRYEVRKHGMPANMIQRPIKAL